MKKTSEAKEWRGEQRLYRVFISYRRSDPTTPGSDGEVARWLQRRLETFSFPRKLVGVTTSIGTVPARLGLVFRDEDYLPAGPELDIMIERALRSSENLVVLCSPAAAASSWVNKEIVFFKSLQGRETSAHARQQVFALIVDGQPHASDPNIDCFPAALKAQFDATGHQTEALSNPLAPDIRQEGRDNAVLRLIAGIFGLDFEDLVAREEQRRRDFRRKSILLFSLGIILSALAIAGIVGTAMLGWRNALARSDLIAANAGQALLDNRTEEGLLIGLSAAPPPKGGVLPVRPAAQRAIATAVLATENLEAVLQEGDLEVRVVEPLHKSLLVLTAGMEGTAKIFDIRSGKTVRSLGIPGAPIRHGAVSLDDKLVAIAPTSGPVVVYPIDGSDTQIELPFSAGEPTAVEFTPDGRWLIVLSEKSFRAWRIGDWSNFHDHEGGGTAMTVSPDSTKLVVGNGQGEIDAYAIEGGPALWQKQVHGGSITALGFSSDGTRLVTASLDRMAKLVDATTGNELAQPMQSSGPVLAAAFSPDGGLVATTSTDGVVELFDGRTGAERLFYPTNAGWTSAIAFSADGKKLAVGSRNRAITVISTPDAKESLVLRGHQGEVLALSFVGTRGELVSGGSDGTIRVWSTMDRRKRCAASLGHFEGQRIVLASAASIAAIQGKDGSIHIFRLTDCKVLSVLNAQTQNASNIVLSPDGSELALAEPGSWEVWATASGRMLSEHKIASASGIALGAGVIALAYDDKVALWSPVATQEQPTSIELPQEIRQIAISPDGQFIGVVLADSTFYVVQHGSSVGRHSGAPANVKWIEFSPSGDQALLGNDDGAVTLVQHLQGDLPAKPLAERVSTAQFLSDSTILYLSFGGIIHALDASTLTELYVYRAVPPTVTVSAISTRQTLVSLGDFGGDIIVRDFLPTGLPLVAYGCQIRPLGSERVLSTSTFRELSGSLGQLLPCAQESPHSLFGRV